MKREIITILFLSLSIFAGSTYLITIIPEYFEAKHLIDFYCILLSVLSFFGIVGSTAWLIVKWLEL